MCDCCLLKMIPERFGIRGPYVRDVPGLDSRVCVPPQLSLGVPSLYIYDENNLLLIEMNCHV